MDGNGNDEAAAVTTSMLRVTSATASTPSTGRNLSLTIRRIQPCDDEAVRALWKEGLYDENNLRMFKYEALGKMIWWIFYQVATKFSDMKTPSKYYSQPGHAMIVLLRGEELVGCTALKPVPPPPPPSRFSQFLKKRQEDNLKKTEELPLPLPLPGNDPMSMPLPMFEETRLSVSATCRGQGLGTLLHTESWAAGKELGYKSCCGRTGNPVAQRLRAKLGYRSVSWDLWEKAL